MNSQDEFHIEEYKCLRLEINNSVEKIFSIIQFVPIAAAAMVAWLATNSTRTVGEIVCLSIPSQALSILWKVPIILGFIGLIFSLIQMFHIFKIGDYLLFLEKRYGYDDDNFGWEKRLKRRSATAIASVIAIWFFFIAGCVYYAFQLEWIFSRIAECK